MVTLAEWEKRLTPFFNQNIRIIGEIPLSESDLAEILDLVREMIGKTNTADTTKKLVKDFPHTFLVMLAHFAAYNEHQGYWNKLNERLSTTQTHGYWWHHEFVYLANKYGLFTFSIEDMKNYYVATIRYHGGIPVYSLPDFFSQMVEPAISKQEYREIPPKQLLKHLIDSANVDRPIKDFLENSGEMGKIWFEECCKLYRHANKNHNELLPKHGVPNLPLYIYSNFERFLEAEEKGLERWRKPVFQAAPYAEETAISLYLPEQTIPMDRASHDITWIITWPGLETPVRIPCLVFHQRHDIVTEAEYYTIPRPTTQVTISIVDEGAQNGTDGELRRWTLPLCPSPGETPIMAFRDSGRYISNMTALPANCLYLLFPSDMELQVTPQEGGRRLESFIGLVGEWSSWMYEFWDLSEALSIQLTLEGKKVGEVIPIAREMAQPYLDKGHLFAYQELHDQPFYTSGLPLIKVPVFKGVHKYQALDKWKVHIRSLWEASPNIDKTFSFQHMFRDVTFEDDWASLPLTALLGESPVGIFDIHIIGPRGLSLEQPIRLWPKLLLHGFSGELSQPDKAKEMIDFYIRVQDGAWVSTKTGVDEVKITKGEMGFRITAPPHLRSISLELLAETQSGGIIRVPASIPVPRLRWGLSEEKTPGDLIFNQTLLHRSIDSFHQYKSSGLHVEMHDLGKMHATGRLKCQLVEFGDEEQVRQIADFFKTDFTRDWLRVSLKQFSTTVQDLRSLARFELVFQKDYQSEVIRYPLLELTPQLAIHEVNLREIGDCQWKLTWDDERPLKNRRLMIRSAWKPWEIPIEKKIPDSAGNELVLRDFSLPPTRYEIYFYIRHQWEGESSEPPGDIDPFIIELCTPEETLLALELTLQDNDNQFKAAIEKACLWDALGKPDKRDIAVSEAAKHLIYLNDIRTLVGSIKWIRASEINPAYKSFFVNNMFNIALVNRILNKYPLYDLNLQDYLKMIASVKILYSDTAKFLLEKVDEPTVFSRCFEELLVKNDPDLVHIILSMMADARLSANDAIDLLMKDINKLIDRFDQICQKAITPFTDRLITGLLPKLLELLGDTINDDILQAILRSIPYETDFEIIKQYVAIMLRHGKDKVLQFLLYRKQVDLIADEEFQQLIRVSPKKSIIAMNEFGQQAFFQDWIVQLEQEFPQAAGILRPGMMLKTPVGDGIIHAITTMEGKELEQTTIDKDNFILELSQGEGHESIRALFDFHDLKIRFNESDQAFCCTRCNRFVHPQRHKLLQHNREKHPYESLSFRTISQRHTFTREDIQYAQYEDDYLEE